MDDCRCHDCKRARYYARRNPSDTRPECGFVDEKGHKCRLKAIETYAKALVYQKLGTEANFHGPWHTLYMSDKTEREIEKMPRCRRHGWMFWNLNGRRKHSEEQMRQMRLTPNEIKMYLEQSKDFEEKKDQ